MPSVIPKVHVLVRVCRIFYSFLVFVKTAIKTFNKYKNRGELFQWAICSVALVTVQIAIYAATLPA